MDTQSQESSDSWSFTYSSMFGTLFIAGQISVISESVMSEKVFSDVVCKLECLLVLRILLIFFVGIMYLKS